MVVVRAVFVAVSLAFRNVLVVLVMRVAPVPHIVRAGLLSHCSCWCHC